MGSKNARKKKNTLLSSESLKLDGPEREEKDGLWGSDNPHRSSKRLAPNSAICVALTITGPVTLYSQSGI